MLPWGGRHFPLLFYVLLAGLRIKLTWDRRPREFHTKFNSMYTWVCFSRVQLFVTPWTTACQAPLSMEFSRQRILEWVAISLSRGSSQPRVHTHIYYVFCIDRWVIHGRDPENWATHWNGWSPHGLHLKTYHHTIFSYSQGGSGLGLQKRRPFTWRWKSKYLVNKWLMDHAETTGHRILINRLC